MAIYPRTVLLVTALAAVSSGCREDPTIPPANQLPIADARVIRDGKSVNERTDGADATKFDYSGAPVAVTLDASKSHDLDGTITAYRWLSGIVAPDGGIPLPDGTGVSRRWVPAGEALNWPGDGVSPTVMLDKGIWSFSLWVTDNGGAISTPDTIKITIGDVVDPVVQQCTSAVISTEPEACRTCLCTQSETCRGVVTMDKCDQTCWDLINCVASNCPDFMNMAAKMDYSCLTANCSAYTGGIAGATTATPCFTACPNDCMHVPYGMHRDAGK